MQITCKQSELSRALTIIGHAISNRSTLPILSNVLLKTNEDRLHLSATNLEIAIHCWIEAQVQEEGAITIPARLMTDFVNGLPATQVEMTTSQNKDSIFIKNTRSDATIRGMNADEFPSIPGAENGSDPITLDAAQLKKAIIEVAFAAAQDDARPVLTGVLVRISEGYITFVGSNGFCLAVRRLSLPDHAQIREDILIPARTLQELARILPASGEVQMIVTPNRSQVLFHSQQSDLVSRLIEGTYPDIYSILPKKYTTRAVVGTKEFAAALKSVVPFAQDNSYITQVKISQNAGNGTLIIEASTDEVGVNVSRIAAAIDGPDQELLFNIKYLANVLSVIDTAEVALEVTSKARPGQLLPVGDTNAQYVIMPMSVNR
jgi:DNA polymerase-3 subunit beta